MKDETDDFLTKLDLIDSNPEVFLTDHPQAPKLNKLEIEQLRVIANGDKQLYKSRKSSLPTSY
jgi:hypothetical protein